MHEKSSKVFIVALLIFWSTALFAQSEVGYVTHWDDGRAMDCPFMFEQETLIEWDQIDPPPVTIETAAAVARLWGEKKELSRVTAISFRLIPVSPSGHEYPMLVMFVNYIGLPPGRLMISSDENYWLAITPSGSVVEPQCEGAQ